MLFWYPLNFYRKEQNVIHLLYHHFNENCSNQLIVRQHCIVLKSFASIFATKCACLTF